jgi:hypothetical protein
MTVSGVNRCVFSNKSPRIATAFGRPRIQASAKQNDLPDMVTVMGDGLPKHSLHRVGLLSVGGRCYLHWARQHFSIGLCETRHFLQFLREEQYFAMLLSFADRLRFNGPEGLARERFGIGQM